jgi:hypothetical protein
MVLEFRKPVSVCIQLFPKIGGEATNRLSKHSKNLVAIDFTVQGPGITEARGVFVVDQGVPPTEQKIPCNKFKPRCKQVLCSPYFVKAIEEEIVRPHLNPQTWLATPLSRHI